MQKYLQEVEINAMDEYNVYNIFLFWPRESKRV